MEITHSPASTLSALLGMGTYSQLTVITFTCELHIRTCFTTQLLHVHHDTPIATTGPLVISVMCHYGVRFGNTAYSRIYTVLDRIYSKIRYGVRYGPNFEGLSQKNAAAFKSALMLGGAAAALPQGLEFALHLFCWALSCCCR